MVDRSMDGQFENDLVVHPPAFLPAKIFGATRVPTRLPIETTDRSIHRPRPTEFRSAPPASHRRYPDHITVSPTIDGSKGRQTGGRDQGGKRFFGIIIGRCPSGRGLRGGD